MSDMMSLQGKCYVAARLSSGMPGAFRFLGDVSEVGFAMSVDLFEKPEHTTGQRLVELRLERQKTATMRMVVDYATKENIALAVRGTVGTVSAGSVTNEALPPGLVVGDIVATAKQRISSLVVEDSAGTPATLTLGTHYSIEDAEAGLIKILNLAAFTQPFIVDYSNAAVSNVPMFTQGQVERWFRFVGVDTANNNQKKMVDLYRVSFDPTEQFDLLTDEINRLPMNGGVLYDSTKAADTVLGQFGCVKILHD